MGKQGRPSEGKNSRSPEYGRDRARGNREFLNEYLREHPCKKCGFGDIRALQFHHRNPAEKLFAVSQYGTRSRAQLALEIAKCDVLCANCHSILHNVDRIAAIERSRERKRKEKEDDFLRGRGRDLGLRRLPDEPPVHEGHAPRSEGGHG